MTSRQQPRSSMLRRTLWLAMAILVAIALYIGGWYYFAGRLQTEVDQTLASLNQGDRQADCDRAQIRGFPFRIGLFCDRVAYRDGADGIDVQTGAFRSAAQIYDPTTIVGELDAPMRAQLPGLIPMELNWEIMRASVRLAQPIPAAISIEGRQVAASASDDHSAMFTAQNGQLHMRTNQSDVDLAAALSDLRIDGLPAETPPMQASINLTVLDGVALAAEPAAIANTGYRTQIRTMTLSFGPEAAIGVSGPLSVDASGLIDADLTLSAKEPDEIARFMATIFPDQAQEIEMAAQGLSLLGNSPTLPLRIAKGRASIAFITLGDIPALKPN